MPHHIELNRPGRWKTLPAAENFSDRTIVLRIESKEVLLRVFIHFLIWVSLLSSGCQAIPDEVEMPPEIPSLVAEPSATSASGSTPQGAPQMTPSPPTPVHAQLQNIIDLARADLAQRLAVLVDDITLVEAANVVWPDSSLGCPEKGMAYAQVLTPGYLVLLEHGSWTWFPTLDLGLGWAEAGVITENATASTVKIANKLYHFAFMNYISSYTVTAG
jgi:hypothetical protein